MSRSDVKELGDLIDNGQAALVIVGGNTIEQAMDKAALKAEKQGLARRTASGGLRGRLSMLYIVLDDVGFSALTPNGGLIQTPTSSGSPIPRHEMEEKECRACWST